MPGIKKGPAIKRGLLFGLRYGKACVALDAVIHLELHRMWGVLEVVDFFPFKVDITVDEVVGEDVAGLEKVATAQPLAGLVGPMIG